MNMYEYAGMSMNVCASMNGVFSEVAILCLDDMKGREEHEASTHLLAFVYYINSSSSSSM